MLRKLWLTVALLAACGTPEEGPTDDPFGDATSSVNPPRSDASTNGDAGTSSNGDAGTSSMDSGAPPRDAGGQVPTDAGSTRDAGNEQDAGTNRRDSGAPTDAGGIRVDAGTTDSGAANGDAGGMTGAKFSFFVTSYASIEKLAKNKQGFGGDLRYGETGAGAGLRGADKICKEIAEIGMPGAGAKQWRAFLSTSTVNAKDRVGAGPWYDRKARLVAQNLAALLKARPEGANPQIIDDLPNEFGVPNHDPDATGQVDNHDMLTGTNTEGTLFCPNDATVCTCSDWTSSAKDNTKPPRVGHSWPRQGSGINWMSSLNEAGCGAGVNLIEMGGPKPQDPTVGSGGGYGGFYCFALTP